MNPLVLQIIVAGVMELLVAPLVVAIMVKLFGRRLDHFDEKRELARVERAEEKKREGKQRDAERNIILAIARTMLLDNYEKCVNKGYYSIDEREVYAKLYDEYKKDGGNGIIDMIADRIRKLPLEPPDSEED